MATHKCTQPMFNVTALLPVTVSTEQKTSLAVTTTMGVKS
jgi:hypothetical protein